MLNDFRFHKGQFSVAFQTVHLRGEDVKSFLQNQSTYHLDQISNKTFQLISFLDPQGRVEAYAWLLFQDGLYSLLVPELLLEQTLKRLNKFLISEDVEISDPERILITFVLGPEVKESTNAFSGILFDEKAWLFLEDPQLAPVVSISEIEKWKALTGWVSFDGSDYSFELLNNLRLYDLSLIPNKGCYPGQETVAKIATRRGAAYSPVLIETSQETISGELSSFGRKIGKSFGCYAWEGKFYLSASLLRDFRVEGMRLQFDIDNTPYSGFVRYYPLIKGDTASKAKELFYAGANDFRDDHLEAAEEKFNLAIKLDPKFADAYESLGVMLGRQDRYQEAIDLMRKLGEVDPKSVLAHTNMSLYFMKLGMIDEAEEQKSLATVKSFQSFGDEAKAREHEEAIKSQKMSEWGQRESMFKQVLEIDPDDTLANFGLGSIAVEKEEWQTAREFLERVLKQDPKYSVAYLALGRALKGLGLLSEAKDIWQEGIKVAASKGDLMPANQMQQELNF